MKKIRILLADDQLLARAGIHALLEALPNHEVVALCADGQQAIDEARRLQPDIAILDIAMPGPSGIEAAKTIRQFDQTIKILILSGIDREEIIQQALAAGINGYLLKDFILEELQQAVDTILSNGRYLSHRVEEILNNIASGEEKANKVSLTARQTEIIRLVASGKTTKEIARQLGISPKTVEFHRSQLMQKLGVHEVTGLTRYAMQNGLIN
ncbi:MAG: DNA-binding response regulator [Rhodocyclales bacterium GT-UBC]|nr:MAG: DNA-binding response regulator [Rhodocyclales bacterium GT-UBC]